MTPNPDHYQKCSGCGAVLDIRQFKKFKNGETSKKCVSCLQCARACLEKSKVPCDGGCGSLVQRHQGGFCRSCWKSKFSARVTCKTCGSVHRLGSHRRPDQTGDCIDCRKINRKKRGALANTCPTCGQHKANMAKQCKQCWLKDVEERRLQGIDKPSPTPYLAVLTRCSRKDGKKSIAQHRLVMERHLGRELVATETVHHINGLTRDNRLENLELWDKSHPAGQRVSDNVEWCRQYLLLHSPELLREVVPHG